MAIKHRIEIKFVGTAPDDEYARAKIIAHPKVEAAIEALSTALKDAGLPHEVTAQTVRTTDQRQNRRLETSDAAKRLRAAAE